MKSKLFLSFLFLGSLFFSQNNWEILNPKPSYGSNKVVAFSSIYGFIVNDSNEMLSTSNSGQTWSVKMQLPSTNDMQFLSKSGYIVGSNGYVLATNDWGQTWSPKNIGTNEDLNSVNIFSDKVIISSASKLYVSSDGISWQVIPINISNPWIIKSVFTNSQNGVIYSRGSIFKTSDGGISWVMTFGDNSTTSDLNVLYFKNQNEGFLHYSFDKFLKTTNGGETWTNITNPFLYRIKSLKYINSTHGFAVGQNGFIYRTTDSGNTWEKYTDYYTGETANNLNSVYFTSSNDGFVVGDDGVIMKTSNLGGTWQRYSFAYESIKNIQKVEDSYTFLSAGVNIFKTTNYVNWQKLSTPTIPETHPYLIDLQFVTSTIGYALVGTAGFTNLSKTTDGGQTWSIIPNSYSTARKIQFIDANIGFRSDSGLSKTTDGGITWTSIPNTTNDNIRFIGDYLGYSMLNSKIYKTENGGVDWNLISGSEYIHNYTPIDYSRIYATGNNSFLKSNDRGLTWEKIDIGKNYTNINFSNPNIGFLSDPNSSDFLYTENGGVTWASVPTAFQASFSTSFNNNLYVGAPDGKLARTNMTYNPYFLLMKEATSVTARNATLSGYLSTNVATSGIITFEYSLDNTFSNPISVQSNPGEVVKYDNRYLDRTIEDLTPSTKYFARIKTTINGNIVYSNVVEFTTLDAFTQIVSFPKIHSNSVVVNADLASNDEVGLQNIKLIYGLDQNNLDQTVDLDPNSLDGNSSQKIQKTLIDLLRNTRYYLKIKFNNGSSEFVSNTYTFKTLDGPKLKANHISTGFFTGFVNADMDVSNIVFQFGSLNFEETFASVPNSVEAGTSRPVRSIGSPNFGLYPVNFYRMKAEHNGSTIYSNIQLEIMGIPIDMARKNEEALSESSIIVNGYLSTDGLTMSNLLVEYGTSPTTFSDSVFIKPDEYSNVDTEEITATLTNLDQNTTYYYRYSAIHNNAVYRSAVYNFRISDLDTNSVTKDHLAIYPNPFDQIIKIDGLKAQPESVQIFDQAGRLIQTLLTNPAQLENGFDLGNISTGTYFLRLKLKSGENVIKKIIKK